MNVKIKATFQTILNIHVRLILENKLVLVDNNITYNLWCLKFLNLGYLNSIILL